MLFSVSQKMHVTPARYEAATQSIARLLLDVLEEPASLKATANRQLPAKFFGVKMFTVFEAKEGTLGSEERGQLCTGANS